MNQMLMYRSFLLLSFTVAAVGCTPQGPAASRLARIEFTPDDTNADKTEVIFSYFDSGYLDKVEYEVDGDEVWEELFNFDDSGQFLGQSREYKEGNIQYTIDATYTWSDGRITRGEIGGGGSGSYDSNGTNVDYDVDISGDVTLTYNDAGLVTVVESNLETKLDQTVEAASGDVELRYADTTAEEVNNTWNDEGLLTRQSSTNDREVEESQDGVETGSSRTETESDEDYAYTDGVLTGAEGDSTYTANNADTRTQYEVSVDFNEDGKLTQMEGTSETNNVETDVEVEITYDDEGRISRIEDRDGNRWDYEYDGTDDALGVTFHPDLLPAFIDIKGTQVMSAVGSQSHLGY